MADRKRKRMVQQQPDRRANRTILVRTLFLLTLFGVAAFVPLLVRLWQIQIRDYDKYQGMAVEQQTADSTVEANRGTIYDRSGETLAMSATVYNIQLSPKEILACQEAYREKAANAAENGKTLDYPEPTNEFIASNLAQILDLDEADILKRLAKTSSMYEMIKWRVEDDERDAVISFINENHITGIYTPPTTKRYYPKNSLADQVIGWVNYSEGRGAYGVEAQYDEALSGETGRIVTAKNGDGTQMLYRYEDYYDATDGDNLTLTLDSAIQSYCESILKKGIEQFEVQDIETAMLLTEHLADYILTPGISSPQEAALDQLCFIMDHEEAVRLIPYVNLFNYGETVIHADNAALTSYGLLHRADYEPMLSPIQQKQEKEMMMQ